PRTRAPTTSFLPRRVVRVTHGGCPATPVASEHVQQEVDAVDGATGEAADDGAVHADVLEVIAGMLLDQPRGALGPERAHAVLDELRDPAVVALHELRRTRPQPAGNLDPQDGVSDQRLPRPLKPLGDPRDRFRTI